MIKGLGDNWVWIYKGQEDPSTGEKATTRYARELLSGEKMTVRQVNTAQNEGKKYEERVPQEERKKYKRKVFHNKYMRYGPFGSPAEALKGTQGIAPLSTVFLQAYGHTPGTKSIKAGKRYVTVSMGSTYNTMTDTLIRLEKGEKGGNRFEQRIDHNLNVFTSIERYYIYRKL